MQKFTAVVLLIIGLLFAQPQKTSADTDLNDPLNDGNAKRDLQMTASLKMEELAACASIVNGTHLLKISVTNNGKRALLLDGDSVSFPEGADQRSLPRNEVIKKPARQTFPEDAIESSFSISSAGLGPVITDEINKAKNPGPAFYGKDEQRRDIDEARFGKRLLFPGEVSSGTMYLSKSVSKLETMKIPVFSHPAGNALGLLEIQINILKGEPGIEKTAPLPDAIEKPLLKKQRIEKRF